MSTGFSSEVVRDSSSNSEKGRRVQWQNRRLCFVIDLDMEAIRILIQV